MLARLAPFALLLALAATPAAAQSVQALGEFRDWAAYSAAEGAGQVCFAMSKPTEVSPPVDGYTQGYLYLTNRPAEGITNEELEQLPESLEGAILPTGQKYEDWRNSKGRGEDGENSGAS